MATFKGFLQDMVWMPPGPPEGLLQTPERTGSLCEAVQHGLVQKALIPDATSRAVVTRHATVRVQ